MTRFLKSFLIGSIIASIFMVLPACSQKPQTDDSFKIVTSFYPAYVAALNVTEEIPGVSLTNLTPYSAGCLHDYQLTTANLKLLEDADVFIANGSGMEDFIDKVISHCPDLTIVYASEDIEQDAHNAHVWTSVSKYIRYVENITSGLAAADQKHAGQYQSNGKSYKERLSALKTKMQTQLDTLSNRNIVVFSDMFAYFAEEFNLHILASLGHHEEESHAAGNIAQMVEIIKQNSCNALFAEPDYADPSIDTISRETGVPVYLLDPVTTKRYSEDRDAYIKAMEENTNTLMEALQ